MRRPHLLAVLGLSITTLSTAQTIYEVELHGGARVLSKDRPVQSGRLALFHRYPDGLLLSIRAGEVVGVATTAVSSTAKTLRPGEAIDVGPTGGSPRPEGGAAVRPPADASGPFGPGPMGVGYGGSGGPRSGAGYSPPSGTLSGAAPLTGSAGSSILLPGPAPRRR